MSNEKMREEFEAAFMRELEVDLSDNRHIDGQGFDCYQFDADDEDERSKLASIAFMFWQQSRAAIEVNLPQRYDMQAGDGPAVYRDAEPNGEWMNSEDVLAAIESLGLKVKS